MPVSRIKFTHALPIMIYMTPPDLSELFSKALSDAKVRLSRPKIQKRLRGKEIWDDTHIFHKNSWRNAGLLETERPKYFK